MGASGETGLRERSFGKNGGSRAAPGITRSVAENPRMPASEGPRGMGLLRRELAVDPQNTTMSLKNSSCPSKKGAEGGGQGADVPEDLHRGGLSG